MITLEDLPQHIDSLTADDWKSLFDILPEIEATTNFGEMIISESRNGGMQLPYTENLELLSTIEKIGSEFVEVSDRLYEIYIDKEALKEWLEEYDKIDPWRMKNSLDLLYNNINQLTTKNEVHISIDTVNKTVLFNGNLYDAEYDVIPDYMNNDTKKNRIYLQVVEAIRELKRFSKGNNFISVMVKRIFRDTLPSGGILDFDDY